MRTRRMAAALVVAMLMVAACGGESNGPKQGVHDAGGKDAFNASLVAENVIADVTVAPAKVGDGTVYRLRGAAGTAANAANLCGKLRVAGENCVVVR